MPREFTNYTSLEAAMAILKKSARVSPRRETIPLGLAYGRVLYGDVLSKNDIPPMDSSHMDGFAVRSSDLASASPSSPLRLRRVAGSALGETPERALKEGEAHSILTGGFLPAGADAVVQTERVNLATDWVEVSSPPSRGEFVYHRGRDVKKGDKVLQAGRTLRGPDLVLLGSLHMESVPVYA